MKREFFNSALGPTWRKIQLGAVTTRRQPNRDHVAISFTLPWLQFSAAQLFHINSFLAPATNKLSSYTKYFFKNKIAAFLT